MFQKDKDFLNVFPFLFPLFLYLNFQRENHQFLTRMMQTGKYSKSLNATFIMQTGHDFFFIVCDVSKRSLNQTKEAAAFCVRALTVISQATGILFSVKISWYG